MERAEEFGVPSQAMRPSAPELEIGPPLTVPGALNRPPASAGTLRPLVPPEEETARSMVAATDEAPRDEDGRGLRSAVYDRTQGTTTSTVQALRTTGAWKTPGRKSDPGR